MKSALFIAALVLGGSAIAQPTQPSGQTVADQSQSTGPQGVTQQGTDPDGQACTPAGFNQSGGGYPPCDGGTSGMASGTGASSGAAAGAGATARPCSRTVTDGCLQTYERGMRPRR